MKALLASLVLAGLMFSIQSNADCGGYSRPISDRKIRSTHQTMLDLLQASPEKQRQAYENVRDKFDSVEALLQFARDYVAVPLDRRLALEHEFADWYRSCVAERDRPHRPNRPTNPGFPNRGTCYVEENCQGGSMPALWGPIGCGMDYKYFRYDRDGICRSI